MSRGWFVVILASLWAGIAHAQSAYKGAAEGRLTVTVTVAGSSTVVIGEDGRLRIVVANAPAAEIAALIPESKTNAQGAVENAADRQSGKRSSPSKSKNATKRSSR